MASGEHNPAMAEDEETTARISLGAGPGIISTPGAGDVSPSGGAVKLSPLAGRDPEPPTKAPLPPIYPSLSGGPGGSVAEYGAQDTIISVPDGDDRTRLGVGKARGMTASDSSRGKAVNTIIYTMDKVGLYFTIEDGQAASAGEMFEYALEELKLPGDQAREVFSLWLVSDLLELQLKPSHVPFKLVCYWDELLEKYTSAPEEDIERDEPILMFQRNVFYPRKKERQLRDPEVLRLLYHEAKENIVDARYPLTEPQLDKMAGLQAHIAHTGYRSDTHTDKYYKSKLDQYYPAHVAQQKSSMFSNKSRLEARLSQWHRAASKKMEGRPLAETYRQYLEECWKLPYYGAAFFRGQVEQPGSALLRSVKDNPVYVAINTDGVFITDMDDVVFLLGLLYEDLSWEFAEPCDRDNRDCLPCLFLQFQDQLKNRDQVTKVLQVFSREAVLMDALIDTCIELKQQTGSEDTTDGLDDDGDGVLKADASTWRQFSRLSLTTYKGDRCIGSDCKKPTTKKRK